MGLRVVILSGVMLSVGVTGALAATPEAAAPIPGSNPVMDGRTLSLDIRPKPLAEALTDWAQQTGLQVIVPIGPETDCLLAARIKGKWTARVALEKLLADTALTYEFINARTILIRERMGVIGPTKLGVKVTCSPGSESAAPAAATTVAAATGAAVQKDALLATTEIDGVVVAGTHIRGTPSAGFKVQIMERAAIKATGYTSVQEILKRLPANLGDGVSEDFDDNSSGNYTYGTGINLRRLGPDATLVLVNGRRQPVSGTDGGFVDVSTIPISAVERIELLPDGTSAVYGSDAIGGVVNIVLRDDYDGAETQVGYDIAGDPRGRTLSQILGGSWDEGSALFGYQFQDREALPVSARAYAQDDKRSLGGDDFRLYLSNPGNILSPTTGLPAYAIPSGQDGTSLQAGDLLSDVVNLQSYREGGDLLPQRQMHSAFFRAHQRIGDSVTLSAAGRYSHREVERTLLSIPLVLTVPASNPFFVDPFGGSQAVLVAYNFRDDFGLAAMQGRTDTFSGSADATVDLPRGWRGHLSATYGEEQLQWRNTNVIDTVALNAALADPDPATAFNPFGDGSHTNPATLDKIRHDTQYEHGISALHDVSLTADGGLFDLPGGLAKLAVGLDYREERLKSFATEYDALQRGIFAGFAELALPVIGAEDGYRAVRQLELSLAARYENYSDVGTTVNPRIGLTWAPVDLLRVRGNWGTSFKAPSLVDGHVTPQSTNISLVSMADPQSDTGQSAVLLYQGKNAQLENETATVWNAGLDFLLPGESAPTLSLTYYDIDFRDRIAEGGPGILGNILLLEDQWADLIRRNPSQTQVAAICNSAQFQGDRAGCLATPVAAVVDVRLRNLGAIRVQGIDFDLARSIPSAWGTFGAGLEGSYVLHYRTAASKQSPQLDIVDTVNNALALRMRGDLSWYRENWSANIFVNYTDDYTDNVSIPHRPVDSWTTIDLRLAYQTPASAQWLADVEISLSAINAFAEDPPFNNSQFGYDPANADPIGRTISAHIMKRW